MDSKSIKKEINEDQYFNEILEKLLLYSYVFLPIFIRKIVELERVVNKGKLKMSFQKN